MNKQKICFFDADGVITDSVGLCYGAVCDVFTAAELEFPSLVAYMKEFDPSNPFSFYRDHKVNLTEKKIGQILNNFLLSHPPLVFPEVREMLIGVKGAGFALAVASANPNVDMMIGVFERAEIDTLFDYLDNGFGLYNKGHYMARLCEEYGYDLETSAMVGDTPSDMLFAENAKLGIRIAFSQIPELRSALLTSPHTDLVHRHDQIVDRLSRKIPQETFDLPVRTSQPTNFGSRIIIP